MKRLFRFTGLIAAAGIMGCTSTDARFGDVAELTRDRTGFAAKWTRDAADDAEVSDYVGVLLREELSVDEAVQVALLSNRRLQSTFENLGIARGNLIGAALPQNPVASDEIRFFDAGAEHEAAVVQDVMSILTIPLRRDRDKHQLAATVAMVTDQVIHVVAETRRAYVDYQAAKQLVELRQQIVLAAESSYDFAERLRAAGNVKQLHVLRERAFYEEAKVQLNAAQRNLALQRERLNGIMGLWGGQTYWQTPARLPEVITVADAGAASTLRSTTGDDAADANPKAMAAGGLPGSQQPGESDAEFRAERLAGPPVDEQVAAAGGFTSGETEPFAGGVAARFAAVEEAAVERNLHLKAVRNLIDAQAAEMDREVLTAIFPTLSLGAVPTWTAEGEFVIGPAGAVSVPIFDFGQAAYTRESARLRMLLEDYAASAVELRAAARATEARVQATRSSAVYQRDVVLPLRAAVVAEAQVNYNAMTVSPFELLVAKRQQIDAAVAYVQALRDYWHARADLEQLLDGGRPPVAGMMNVGGMP